MLTLFKYLSVIIFIYLIISCSSSKQEIDIENETAESLLQKSNLAFGIKKL